jgi:hypothetical protein
MSDVDIEYQSKIPILILDPSNDYYPDVSKIKQCLSNDISSQTEEIILDLSNYLEVNADLLNHLAIVVRQLGESIKRFGVVIPHYVSLEGLKVKLIDDIFEVFESKYDAVYSLIN